ncbi:hypothetical protein J4471_04085 [Candidatus Woesearchaeota archaeon]|nr:hypothetical protein [Candidatus Woesearchaeota archaeon]
MKIQKRMIRNLEYINYKFRHLVALIVIIIVWLGINLLIQKLDIIPRFLLSFFLMVFFVSFSAFLIRRLGIALLLIIMSFIAIKSLPDLVGLGYIGLLSIIIVGLIFEFSYLILYMKNHLVSLDIILAITLSFASIPLWTGLLLSPTLVSIKMYELLNLILLDFFVALAAVLLAFLLWFHIRVSRLIVLFENAP